MPDQWSRFNDSTSRSLDALGAQQVDVYEPTETYTQGDGWSVSYPDTPSSTTEGEAVPPESDPNVDAGGTTETSDMGVYVSSSAGVSWTDYGESGQAVTRIDVAGTRYEVTGVDPQFDGRERLECTEVDT